MTGKGTLRVGRDESFPRLLGDRLCLDFVNTIDAPFKESPVESLRDYRDLARWAWHAGVLARVDSDRLIETAAGESRAARAAYRRAVALRLALDEVFRSVARSELPDDDALERVWDEYAVAIAHSRLQRVGSEFDWSWEPGASDLDLPLWPVARSAVELLTSEDLSRVKECPGAGDCGWLFYDTSRNGVRRWCSMEGCGSRVKMRRYYAHRRG